MALYVNRCQKPIGNWAIRGETLEQIYLNWDPSRLSPIPNNLPIVPITSKIKIVCSCV